MDTKQKPPRTAWKPGQSGNPNGRPKRKPITDVLRRALVQPVNGRDKRPLSLAIKDRLVQIILHGEEKYSLAAIRLYAEYVQGKPESTVAVAFDRALVDMAQRTGAPLEFLRRRAREMAVQYAQEGGDDEGMNIFSLPERIESNRVVGRRKGTA